MPSIQTILKNPQVYMGKAVTMEGRVRTARTMKNIAFLEVWDGSAMAGIQVVSGQGDVPTGAVVRVTGRVAASPAAGQAVEIQADEVQVTGDCPADYPLQKKRHSFEYLRTLQHLRPRTNTFYAVFKIRSVLSQAIHAFFAQEGFVYVHTPLITGSDCEGAGEMFRVTAEDGSDFFHKPTHLTVSGQLNAEAFALAFGNCYTFGPTFRAENSNTPRHAAEFWMVEPEMAYCDLAGNMENAEKLLKYCMRTVLEKAADEMAFCDKFIAKGVVERLERVAAASFARLTYTEAIQKLEKAACTFAYPVYWGCDLQTEHERYLSEEVCRRPVFVTDYPRDIKAFYMRQNDDQRTVAAMDLLAPGVGEIIGGSQREERYDVLRNRMAELGLDLAAYDWYLDLRRYGTIRHSGYGLGLERMLMYITGMQNIRDVLPFPRTPGNAEF